MLVGGIVDVEDFDVVDGVAVALVDADGVEGFAFIQRGGEPDLVAPDDGRGPAGAGGGDFPFDVLGFGPGGGDALGVGVAIEGTASEAGPVVGGAGGEGGEEEKECGKSIHA